MNALMTSGRWAVQAALLLATLPAALCRGETAGWTEPDLDTWVYPNAIYVPDFNVTPGNRAFGPSFGGLSLDPETDTLNPGFASRGGYSVFAFETTEQIDAGLAPERYQINSVTVTVTAERGQDGDLTYSATPLTIESATDAVRDSNFGVQVPMELFGVGFNGLFDFEGFDLGLGGPGVRYSEADDVWGRGADDREYILYPADAQGRDSVNSLNGGFSASEELGETDPFTHEPFAIGTVPGVSEGQTVPQDTTFTFDLDLSNPGVVDYLQTGLADGVVGFTLSTLHSASMTGNSNGGFYPQWYMKEAADFFANTVPATLDIDFAILPEVVPGDYNADGLVTEADYATWIAEFGDTPTTPGLGADGNGDGLVDSADYTVWRDAFASAAASIAVPEPSGGVYALIGVATVSFCVGTCVFARPRRRRP